MTDTPSQPDVQTYQALRRCILTTLYGTFREYPYASIELSDIKYACHADVKELNWNLVYLEKCGYVELGRSIDCPPYIASSVSITALGIDLVEDAVRFNKRFPQGTEENSPS